MTVVITSIHRYTLYSIHTNDLYYIRLNNLLVVLLVILVLISLIESLLGLGGNTVQISLSILGDLSGTGSLVFKDSELLQSLDGLSVDGTGSIVVLVWSGTSVVGTSVKFVQFTDTNVLSQVDVSSDRGGSLVEPSLGILWWHLIAGACFHSLDIRWNFELTLSLQELGVVINEILCRNVSVIMLV